jgi:predicted nucleic acid-binding protein
MAVVLDSDAVIGFLDRSDALHSPAEARIGELLAGGEPLIASVVTFAEVLAGAKLGHHDEGPVRGFFSDLITEIVPVDVEAGERAAELRGQRRSLRMPDALILATADLHVDVGLVVCGDKKAMALEGLSCEVQLLKDGG